MGHQRRRLILLPLLLSASIARAQLPTDVQDVLATAQDNQLNFDQPAVYRLLAHLQETPNRPGRYQEPLGIADLPDVIARPSDHRGLPLRVRGRVGRLSSWKRREGLGAGSPIWQLELQVPSSPLPVTVLLTEPADDLALGSEIEVVGYFILMRHYHDTRGRRRAALLLGGHAPDAVIEQQLQLAPVQNDWQLPLLLTTSGAAVAWLLLRSWTRTRRPATRSAPKPAAFSVAEDYARYQRDAEESDE